MEIYLFTLKIILQQRYLLHNLQEIVSARIIFIADTIKSFDGTSKGNPGEVGAGGEGFSSISEEKES